ncbi:MAG: 4-hydroxy-3-methylbut-2-enyl diphosphate reductase [Bacteroidaceae bacterium]|nr:4-hydroxy-3-methylbut-2-enyl diphosphate reductase [Bacteroidaceae bacterium]
MNIEIDSGSGFCHGVTRAIGKAEEELAKGCRLYCLGDIVHNGREVQRLDALGLRTINHEQFAELHDANVLLRAHGEPPSTYQQAAANNINIIDATCPVVLHLQERIKREYDNDLLHEKQIVIFGKRGHAEVLGLVGQTNGTAIVLEHPDDVARLDFSRDICLYSQTTKSLEDFRKIVDYIQQHIAPTARFTYADTVCRQVANRMPHIREFASRHDVVLFVCGQKSSNGRVLFDECRKVNPRSYMIDSPEAIDPAVLSIDDAAVKEISIGICGATSTPKWLMEQCKEKVESLYNYTEEGNSSS